MENISQIIEAVLFYKNEPVSSKELCKILEKTEIEIQGGINILRTNLEGRGLSLVENAGQYSLATSTAVSDIINKITKDELSKDLGKASLETLSIILYSGPISRREIDYVRGVNSNFILRSLLVRGLIEKQDDSKARSFVYKPTIELLAYLGVESVSKLPNFERVKGEIDSIMQSKEEAVNRQEDNG